MYRDRWVDIWTASSSHNQNIRTYIQRDNQNYIYIYIYDQINNVNNPPIVGGWTYGKKDGTTQEQFHKRGIEEKNKQRVSERARGIERERGRETGDGGVESERERDREGERDREMSRELDR